MFYFSKQTKEKMYRSGKQCNQNSDANRIHTFPKKPFLPPSAEAATSAMSGLLRFCWLLVHQTSLSFCCRVFPKREKCFGADEDEASWTEESGRRGCCWNPILGVTSKDIAATMVAQACDIFMMVIFYLTCRVFEDSTTGCIGWFLTTTTLFLEQIPMNKISIRR